jgi:Tol biopolymer transport system component
VARGGVILLCAGTIAAVLGCGLDPLTWDDYGGVHIHDPPPPMYYSHHEWPDWSCEGLIAYVDHGFVAADTTYPYEWDPDRAGIWVIDPSTGDKGRILAEGTQPAWSPDASRLALTLRGHIYTADSSGADVSQLTPVSSCTWPDWSPDGVWVAYDYNGGIWSIPSDGGNIDRHLDDAWHPDWHPVDRWSMVCVARLEGRSCIAVLDPWIPGGETQPVPIWTPSLDPLQWTKNPSYSPDGGRIAFELHELGPVPPQIWIIESDGSGPRQVTSEGGSYPSWSPDGTELVYTKEDVWSSEPHVGVLWVLNPDTGHEWQLTQKQ